MPQCHFTGFGLGAPKKEDLSHRVRPNVLRQTNLPDWLAPKTFGDSPAGQRLPALLQLLRFSWGESEPEEPGGTRRDRARGAEIRRRAGPDFFSLFPGELIHETQKQTKIR